MSASEVCLAGTYRNTEETCTKCAVNTFSMFTAASQCTSCNEGEVANTERTFCGEWRRRGAEPAIMRDLSRDTTPVLGLTIIYYEKTRWVFSLSEGS